MKSVGQTDLSSKSPALLGLNTPLKLLLKHIDERIYIFTKDLGP